MKNRLLSSSPISLYTLMFKEYPDLVNVDKMCAMLGVISCKTAYKLLRANQINHFKIDREYRIPKIHLISYLESIMEPLQNKHTLTL